MPHDIIAFFVSCLLILVYYLHLVRRVRRGADLSIHSLNARIREQWVEMIMRSGKMEILSIQTLRNSVMAANFMATTAILLIIGILNMSEKIGEWALNRPYSVSDYALSSELWQIKLVLLLLDFFIAFYFFSMSIRFFNHVGYMINLPSDASSDGEHYKRTCAYLNKAGSYYAFGTRAFFFSLPIILWFFGDYFLVLGTLALIAGLAMNDSVPR
jgi:uncharacterized membrane protein